jgi:hypothetical protein
MKWLERTAQGFNPGLADQVECPESGTNLASAGCNSEQAQPTLRYSSTPTLRPPGFEDEDDYEYENEAPQEWHPKFGAVRGISAQMLSTGPSGATFRGQLTPRIPRAEALGCSLRPLRGQDTPIVDES